MQELPETNQTMSKKYNGWHRQQLFHWIGAELDTPSDFTVEPEPLH
jgi:hypothetical protein